MFGKKSKGSRAQGGAAASALIEDEASGHMIVLGSGWRTLVSGRNPQAMAKQIIKPFKPSHYLLHRYLVGWCSIQDQLPARYKGKIYSASMLVSKMHSGVNLYLLDIGDGRYWLALTRNNAPTATDEVLQASEPAEALRRARELIEQFDGEFITVYTDLDRSTLDGAKAFGLSDLLGVPRSEDEEFKPAKFGGSVPAPVAAVGVVILFGLAAYKGWEQYKIMTSPPPLPIIEDPDDPPDVAWKRRLDEVEAGLVAPQNAALYAAIRQDFIELPAQAGGWRLTGARCERADDLSSRKSAWSCVGNYERLAFGITSPEMQAAAERFFPGKELSFPELQKMQARWSRQVELTAMPFAALPVQSDVQLYTMGVLQRGSLALAEDPVLRYDPIPIEPPKKKNGTAYTEMPSFGVPDLVKSDLVLRGSIGAIDFAVTNLAGYSWKSVGMQINGDVGEDVSLKSSVVDMEVTGEWLGLRAAYSASPTASAPATADIPPGLAIQ